MEEIIKNCENTSKERQKQAIREKHGRMYSDVGQDGFSLEDTLMESSRMRKSDTQEKSRRYQCG